MMTDLVESRAQELKEAVDRALDSGGMASLEDLRVLVGSAKDGVGHYGTDESDGRAASAEAAEASGRRGSQRVSAVWDTGAWGNHGEEVPAWSYECCGECG